MQKKPYLLLELLIAFTIVALCAVPFVRTPVNVFETEMRSLEKMTLQRQVELDFASVKEELYKNQIAWKILMREKAAAETHVSIITLSMGKDFKRDYERTRALYAKTVEEGRNNEEHALLTVHFSYKRLPKRSKDSVSFHQEFFLTKIPKEKASLENPGLKK